MQAKPKQKFPAYISPHPYWFEERLNHYANLDMNKEWIRDYRRQSLLQQRCPICVESSFETWAGN